MIGVFETFLFLEIDKNRCDNPIQRPRKPKKTYFQIIKKFFFANLAAILDFLARKGVFFSKSLNSYSSSFKKFILFLYTLGGYTKGVTEPDFFYFCLVLLLNNSKIWKISKNSKISQNSHFLSTLSLIFEKYKTKFKKRAPLRPLHYVQDVDCQVWRYSYQNWGSWGSRGEKKITFFVKATGMPYCSVKLYVHDFELV